MQQKIVPNLWFDTEAEEAAEFYTSVFDNSRIVNVTHYTKSAPREAGMVMKAMLGMRKIDLAALRGAADDAPAS